MRTSTSGSHQRVSIDWILDYEFNLPSRDEQKRISSILSSIDMLIKCNGQLNDYLAEPTKALFTHWFKDFVPFENDETYESEIGDILVAIELVPLSKLMKVITKGTTPTTLGYEYKEAGINFIK